VEGIGWEKAGNQSDGEVAMISRSKRPGELASIQLSGFAIAFIQDILIIAAKSGGGACTTQIMGLCLCD